VLQDLEARTVIDPVILSQALGITHAQAHVASLLSSGLSIDEIAVERGISVETARNHIKSVFARTGTSRQGELIALIARLHF
jgi:DNA-binding CsgD family transcriptional regulator